MIKLGFDDEDTSDSVARLFQKTGDLNRAFTLNALAMDMARARNKSVEEATQDLIRVMAGRGMRTLVDYNVQIKKGASVTQQLADIQKKTKGQAEEYSKTTAASLDELSISWQNLKESVGEFLVKGLRLPKLFNKISEGLTGMTDAINNLISGKAHPMTALKEFFSGVRTFLPRWSNAQQRILPVFASGGIMKNTGLAMLHAGERVTPASQVSSGRGATVNFYGGITNTSNQSLDAIGRRIARQIELSNQGAF